MTDQAGIPTEPRAEVWLRERDPGIRIIAAEMAEYAGRVNVLWARVLDVVASDPDWSLSRLVDLQILLENHLPLEIEDILKVVREGTERLAAELPDDDDGETGGLPTHSADGAE